MFGEVGPFRNQLMVLRLVFQVYRTLKPDDIIHVTKRALLNLQGGMPLMLFEPGLKGCAANVLLKNSIRIHNRIILVLFQVWDQAFDADVSALSLIQRALIPTMSLFIDIFKVALDKRLRIV